jgi:hypothetical protein
MEIQGFKNTPGDLLGPKHTTPLKRVWILVAWLDDLPSVSHYEDEHTAIEALKDALPVRDRAHLFYSDETGGWGRVPGWH